VLDRVETSQDCFRLRRLGFGVQFGLTIGLQTVRGDQPVIWTDGKFAAGPLNGKQFRDKFVELLLKCQEGESSSVSGNLSGPNFQMR